MSEEKGLKFVRMIPYIIISVILIEIGIVVYDLFLKETKVDTNNKPEEVVSLVLSKTEATTTTAEEITIEIKGENYGELSCKSLDEKIATCSIKNKKLYIAPGEKKGNVEIEIKESNENKKVVFNFTNKEVANQNIVSNPVTTTPVQTKPVVSVVPQPKPVVTTSLGLASTSGIGYINGNSISIGITGTNYGQLTCTSSDTKIATCSISGSTLTIIPKTKVGKVNIEVKETKENKTTTFTLEVKKEYECTEGTLVEDDKKGFICLTDGYEDYKEVCTQYKTTQHESDPICASDNMTGVYNDETLIIGCSNEKITDESFGCNDQYLCVIVEIEKECIASEYESNFVCPSGFYKYAGNDNWLECYKRATLKK